MYLQVQWHFLESAHFNYLVDKLFIAVITSAELNGGKVYQHLAILAIVSSSRGRER